MFITLTKSGGSPFPLVRSGSSGDAVKSTDSCMNRRSYSLNTEFWVSFRNSRISVEEKAVSLTRFCTREMRDDVLYAKMSFSARHQVIPIIPFSGEYLYHYRLLELMIFPLDAAGRSYKVLIPLTISLLKSHDLYSTSKYAVCPHHTVVGAPQRTGRRRVSASSVIVV